MTDKRHSERRRSRKVGTPGLCRPTWPSWLYSSLAAMTDRKQRVASHVSQGHAGLPLLLLLLLYLLPHIPPLKSMYTRDPSLGLELLLASLPKSPCQKSLRPPSPRPSANVNQAPADPRTNPEVTGGPGLTERQVRMPPRAHEHSGRKTSSLQYVVQKYLLQMGTSVRMAPGTTIAVTAIFTVFGTSGYVLYRDWRRERRMMDQFAKGNILEPLTTSSNEVRLFKRQMDMGKLRHVLRSDICNQYYLIFGEVGSGKTRLITEVVRSMISDNGEKKQGAPIYVLASQGLSFPDSFANAVDFHFDEHISLKFVLDYIFRVGQLPERDEKSKLERLLDALERAAYHYLQKSGKPAVIVIDGVDWITERMPEAITLLQEKAKVWADTHIAKVVFVSNHEKTEEIMQRNHSAWSRAATPIVIGDLSVEDAKEFLNLYDPVMTKATMECRKRRCKGYHQDDQQFHNHENKATPSEEDDSQVHHKMPEDYMDEVINLVGGRIQNLLVAKREWLKGSAFEETASHLKMKERSKFVEILKCPARRRVLELLFAAEDRRMLLSDLIDLTSREDVFACAFNNVIRIIGDSHSGLHVHFESRLTEVVVKELFGKKAKPEQTAGTRYTSNDFVKWVSSFFDKRNE